MIKEYNRLEKFVRYFVFFGAIILMLIASFFLFSLAEAAQIFLKSEIQIEPNQNAIVLEPLPEEEYKYAMPSHYIIGNKKCDVVIEYSQEFIDEINEKFLIGRAGIITERNA